MKRYLLFVGLSYYPNKAWDDFSGDFDTIEDAEKKLENYEKDDFGWFQIVDTETKKIEKEGDI